MKEAGKGVGKTKDAGFEIGVRRTFEVTPEKAWEVLNTPSGLHLWLGDIEDWQPLKGFTYSTQNGTLGEVRAVTPGGHIRLTWQPQGWPDPSTLQVRLIPHNGRTTISFHQERLADAELREAMRLRWEEVLQGFVTCFYNIE